AAAAEEVGGRGWRGGDPGDVGSGGTKAAGRGLGAGVCAGEEGPVGGGAGLKLCECVNSVVRMHQARHRNLSQGLLDLKRLYFNCRGFTQGKRKGRCPYQLLGLKLPSYDPWALLQMDPDQLEHLLSSSGLPS